jgi:8-oxo-dGTP diphosphatase
VIRLLYGTGNPAKLNHMREMLAGLPLAVDGLDGSAPDAQEDGVTPLENARQKAQCYYRAFLRPVFSCDSGLFIEGVPKGKNPGVHARRPEGRSLSDEEMIAYYAGLVREYGQGGALKARYQNAICLVMGEGLVWEYDGEDIGFNTFLLTDKPHEKRTPGWPLDSLSLSLPSGKYSFDLTPEERLRSHRDLGPGFARFFRDALAL